MISMAGGPRRVVRVRRCSTVLAALLAAAVAAVVAVVSVNLDAWKQNAPMRQQVRARPVTFLTALDLGPGVGRSSCGVGRTAGPGLDAQEVLAPAAAMGGDSAVVRGFRGKD